MSSSSSPPDPSAQSTAVKLARIAAWATVGAAAVGAFIGGCFLIFSTLLSKTDESNTTPRTSAAPSTTAEASDGGATSGVQSSSSPVPTSGAVTGAEGVLAVIQNTWDSERQSLVGVSQFPSPNSSDGKVDGPGESQTVVVVCQVLDGRRVTDTEYRDRPTSSTRWDQLANGLFISDIYTNLPKPEGQPAPGLPECG